MLAIDLFSRKIFKTLPFHNNKYIRLLLYGKAVNSIYSKFDESTTILVTKFVPHLLVTPP